MIKDISKKLCSNVFVYMVLAILITVAIGKVFPRIVANGNWFNQKYECNKDSDLNIEGVNGSINVEQTFYSPCAKLKGFDLSFKTDDKVNHGILSVILMDMNKNVQVGSWTVDTAILDDAKSKEFDLETAYDTSESNLFSIIVKAENDAPETGITICASPDDRYENGELLVNGEKQNGDLTFSLYGYYGGNTVTWLFYGITFCIIALIMFMVYLLVSGHVESTFDEVNKVEWIFVLAMFLLGCFIFSQGKDMILTVEHARDLLHCIKNGHFFDFYTFVMEKALNGGYYEEQQTILSAANYNIFLYLILAISILPLIAFEKLTGIPYSDDFSVMYVNVLLTVAVFFSAYLLFDLAKEMGQSQKRAKVTSYFYLSSMLLVFSTVGFSQLDIVYIIIILWSLKFYLRQQYMKFSLLMSVGIMLKMFPLLIFVPLILLVEKRVLHIMKYMVTGVSATLMCKIIFGSNYGYSVTQEKLSAYYGFMGRLFANGISVFQGSCAFFVLIVIVLCIYTYDKKCRHEDLWKYVITIPLIVYVAFMMFILWHPQWLSILAPFMALALSVNMRRRSLIFLEWGIGTCVYVASAYWLPGNVDNYMCNHGILKSLTGVSYGTVTMSDIFEHIDNFGVILATGLFAMAGYFVIAATRDIFRKQSISEELENNVPRWTVWIRMASMYAYCLLIVCLYFFA